MFGKKIVNALAVIAISVGGIVACSDSNSSKTLVIVPPDPPVYANNEVAINELWKTTISQLLTQSLWTARDSYDSSHLLLQPMQYAFKHEDLGKIAEFEAFFSQLNAYFDEAKLEDRVASTQFMFFASEYLVLQHKRGLVSTETLFLYEKLQTWLVEFMYGPAWLWDRAPFETLMARTDWKLDTQEVNFSYYRAFFDEGLHSYAALANLAYLSEQPEFTFEEARFSQLKTIAIPQIKRILEQEVTKLPLSDNESNQAWLFQPGVWYQHPDYEYAGHAELASDLTPSLVQGIAIDSSHMHRWPVWLKAYKRAFTSDIAMQNYVTGLEKGLALQFNDKVYVSSTEVFPSPRLNNYFDGQNGLYRYNHSTSQGSGVGPYQLSAILYVGWYGNLDNASNMVKDIESLLENGMQLSQGEIATLVGPNTTRERHPLYVWPDYFTNGMAELNIRITLNFLKNET